MATKIADDLVAGDRITWDMGGTQTPFTVASVLVIPPEWPTPDQVTILVTDSNNQQRFLSAQYGQELEVPAW